MVTSHKIIRLLVSAQRECLPIVSAPILGGEIHEGPFTQMNLSMCLLLILEEHLSSSLGKRILNVGCSISSQPPLAT